MNQIQEKDWADTSWHGHTGIDSTCDYCIIDETSGETPPATPGANTGTEAETDRAERDRR